MLVKRPLLTTVPIVLLTLNEARLSCFFGFGGQTLARNKLEGRINNVEYPANNPIEDRMLTYQLTSYDGYVAAVFDGHGGWQMVVISFKTV
jgi:hypothetical protein